MRKQRSDKGKKHKKYKRPRKSGPRGPYKGTKRKFSTSGLKTTNPFGFREYMRQFMKASRDLTRVRKYSPRRKRKKKKKR